MSRGRRSVDDDRRVLFDILIDLGGVGWRQVDAAVGTVGKINITAKAAAPLGVMQADAAVKRHPE